MLPAADRDVARHGRRRAGVLTTICHIPAPLAAPGLTAAALFVFLSTWAAYLIRRDGLGEERLAYER